MNKNKHLSSRPEIEIWQILSRNYSAEKNYFKTDAVNIIRN